LTCVSLRLEVIAPRDVDDALCDLGQLMLERCPDGTFLEVAEDLVARARAALGRCGIDVEAGRREPPTAVTVPGTVRDLAPVRASGVTDRVWVRAIGIAHATTLCRKGILRRYDPERLRPLLREEDRAYAWRRVVWMPRSAMRVPELRGVRPIVFDRAALTAGRERYGFTGTASLARWLAA
jgi:hypothetical protein